MYGVKNKVGPLCCVVVCLVLVLGEIWEQLEKSTPPPSEGRRGTKVLHHLNCKQAVPFSFTNDERQYLSDLQRGKRGIRRAGCSFPAVPLFRRRPKPTIPLHSIKDQPCFWHHTLSTNSTSTISSSILCTTRRGGLYNTRTRPETCCYDLKLKHWK